jgi:hypothetical protein
MYIATKLFNKCFKSFKSTVFILFISITILFILITISVIENKLSNFVDRADLRAKTLENFVDLSISNAQQVMQGLAIALVQEPIDINNKNIQKLVDNFNTDLNCYMSIPFYGFKVFNPADIIIYHTLIPPHLFVPMKSIYDIGLLTKIKETPFSFKVGPIRLGTMSGEVIIPFCVAINKLGKQEYLGSICSGLKVKEVNKQLNATFSAYSHGKISLKNNEDNTEEGHYIVNNVFTVTNMLQAYF